MTLIRTLFTGLRNTTSSVAVYRIIPCTRIPITPQRPYSDTPNANPPKPPKYKSHNLPSRPKPPPDSEIEEYYLKGSGPGGQKINKTSSAVQLIHKPTGIVVKSQATRSQSQNRKIARQLLADKLDDIARGDESRSAVVDSVKRKKRSSSAKKSRRKYRKLAEEKEGAAEDEECDIDEPLEGSEEERTNQKESDPRPDDRQTLLQGKLH
ncbi:RF-1 domain-containing protein [Xylariaceae sp. FL1019]|nr:RF-1 domain-containing protein [Xylariaceae sp. FL1019]